MGVLSKYGREYGSQFGGVFFTIRGEGVANRKTGRLDLICDVGLEFEVLVHFQSIRTFSQFIVSSRSKY